MAEKNPFAVLGFAPNAFNKLSDDDIRSLVRAQYRALAGLHHPDHRGGNSERFKEVQEAFEKLEQDFEFQFWKGIFLRPRKDQLTELRKERDAVQLLAHHAQVGLKAFWEAYCQGRKLLRVPWPQIMGPQRHEELESFSVFNPPPLSILITAPYDLLVRKAVHDNDNPEGAKAFELRLMAPGVMTRQDVLKTNFDPRERWRPPVRQEWITLRNPPAIAKSFYWGTEGEPEAMKGKLLGSLPNELAVSKSSEPKPIRALISTATMERDIAQLTMGYTLEEFQPFLPFLRPQVAKGRWLINAEGDENHVLRFQALGRVFKILPLESTSPRPPDEQATRSSH